MKNRIEEAVGDSLSEQDMLKTLVEGFSSFYRIVFIMNCMTVAAICSDLYFLSTVGIYERIGYQICTFKNGSENLSDIVPKVIILLAIQIAELLVLNLFDFIDYQHGFKH